MCNERYEERDGKLWKLMCTRDEGDNNSHKVMSYFVKKSHGQKFDITGKVKVITTDYKKVVNLDWVLYQLKTVIYTKKGDLRKKFVDGPAYEHYNLASLLHYIDQATSEGTSNVILSWKEYFFLKEGKW